MKTFNVKPIETNYNGVLFRSRTEARWAVFFDSIGIKWLYEYEGYDLGILGKYLPDFYLPTFGGSSFAEIKGVEFSDLEDQKCKALCKLTGKQVILFDGVPELKAYKIYLYVNNELITCCGIPNADQANGCNNMFYEPGYQNNDLTITGENIDCLGFPFINAVNKAKSYRF